MNMASFGKQEAALPLPRSSSEVEEHLVDSPRSINASSESDARGQAADDTDLAKHTKLSEGLHTGKLKET